MKNWICSRPQGSSAVIVFAGRESKSFIHSFSSPRFSQTKHGFIPVTVWSHAQLSNVKSAIAKMAALLNRSCYLDGTTDILKKPWMWFYSRRLCHVFLTSSFIFFGRHFLSVVWIQNWLPRWGRSWRDGAFHSVYQHHVCHDTSHHGHAKLVAPAVS